MLLILTLANPFLFGVTNLAENLKFILYIFVTTVILPGIAIAMLKPLGFVDSIEMHTNKERIGPLIIASIFYFWTFINLKNNVDVSEAFVVCVLGSSIALGLAFFINIFQKISLHAIGVGGLLAMVLICIWLYNYGFFTIRWGRSEWEVNIEVLLYIVILISGLVCTARLYLKSHNIQEILGGFFIGFVTQWIALKLLIL
jgi:hypothetical protein